MKREWSDEDLAVWLASVRAEPGDAPLARALARLEADRLPAWCAWTARPWALAAATAVLVISLVGGAWLARQGVLDNRSARAGTFEADPIASLVDEDLTRDLGLTPVADIASDSGGAVR